MYATIKTDKIQTRYDVLNPNGWWGKTYLVTMEHDTIVVEADNEQEALDFIADSSHYEFIKCETETETYAGNECKPVDLECIISIKKVSCLYHDVEPENY